jgi:formylglycine-generating enzyme required for sulfatase activity
MTYFESQKACAELGKRVCTDEEWTFACEGEEALPYAYGYERDPDKCNADHGWTQYDAGKLAHRTQETAMEEVDRLWKGLPSGSMTACRSPFGVYDLTGNIDEWTQNKISGGKYKGSMKGGYWGPVRARCRPATIAHNEEHFFYQEGTRCCSDE